MIRRLYVCLSAGLFILSLAVSARPAGAQTLNISGDSVAFFSTQGNNPANQNIFIHPGAGLNPAIKVTTANGGDWLTVLGNTSGLFGENFQLSFIARSQALAPGDYSGQATVTQSGVAQFPLVIPVTLRVNLAGAFLAPSPDVINLSVNVGANAPSTVLAFRNVGSSRAVPAISKTSTGGDWIVLSAPIAGTLNPDVFVTVNYATSGLAAGFYSGVITGTAIDALNSPVNVPLNLKVGATTQGPALAASPVSLSFTAGGVNPAAQTISLNNSGQGAIDPLVQTSTTDGGAWLNVTLSAAATGGARTATVSVNASGLALGNYSGRITVIDGGAANSPLNIPVTLAVTQLSQAFSLKTNVAAFSVNAGAPKQSTTVDVTAAAAISFTATLTTSSGGNWLAVSPSSGNAPATLTLTADPTGLAQGAYQGKVTVTGAGVSQEINVILGIGVKLPTINAGGLVNGASFASQTLAAGEIGSAFGLDYGLTQGITAGFVDGKLPAQLGGLSINFDGRAAPLYFANSNQINVQVPFEVAGKASTQVQVISQGIPGPVFTLNLRDADPGIFQANGRMTVFNQSFQQILTTQPAAAGDALTMYATGLGALSTAVASGAPGPGSPPATTATTPVITVGGRPATILFSGYAPGFVGLYQVNFTVPTGLTAGDQPLILAVGSAQSAPQPLAVR